MTDHAPIQFSPLKTVRIPLLIDRTADFVERPLGRSPRRPSPLKNQSDRPVWVSLPTGSLCPKHKDLATPCVPIRTRLAYRPNLRPPPQIGVNPSANHPVSLDGNTSDKGRKVIVSRQLLVNGNITFVVGTRFGGIVNRDPKEVPLSQILSHVSQAELQRFENRDFLEEDIREANQPPPKPKGRPVGSRLIDGRLVLAGASAGPLRAHKPQAQLGRPVVLIPNPSRALQQGGAFAPSSQTSHLAVKVPAFNETQQVAVRVPSFNGPQPGHIRHVSETDASSESSEDELKHHRPTRRPQYAMIAASGLAPSETSLEGETSREVSMSRAPSHEASRSYDREQSPKRRRLDTQLPLRATGPTMQSNGNDTVEQSYSDNGTFFDKLFQESTPSASLTQADRIVYDLFDDRANSLPTLWPGNAPSTAAPRDDPSPPPKSSFPPGSDRGRYPAQRRRRGHKFFTPKRTAASIPDTFSNSSMFAARASHDSSAQSELDDVEMVDIVEIRDEEAEREALLRQFQPTNIRQSRQPSSSPNMPEPATVTPPRKVVPNHASPPLLAEKASPLPHDILSKVNGQSEHVPPPPTFSVQVTTPGKSIQKRDSPTPHYPRGVKFASGRASGWSNTKIHAANPNHSLRNAETSPTKPMSTKRMDSAFRRIMSPESATPSTARLAESNLNGPISQTATEITASNSSKPPPPNSTKLTVPTKHDSSNHTIVSPPINGTASKRIPKSPTPTNDITRYFRPKSSTVKTPQLPTSEGDETESEDPLTRASSYDSLNPNVPIVQRRSQPNTPNPNPAQRHDENDSRSDSMNSKFLPVQRRSQHSSPYTTTEPPQNDIDSDSDSDSMNSAVLHVQHRSQHNAPSRALENGSRDEAVHDAEMLDFEEESQNDGDEETMLKL